MEAQYALAVRFMEAMGQMNRAIHRVNITGMLSKGAFMLLTELDVQARYNGREQVRISDLSRCLDRSMPSLTRAVGELESAGYVERCLAPNDRRMVLVQLTDAGRRQLAQARQVLADTAGQMLQQMGEQDAQTLICLLEKAKTIFQGMNEEKCDD